MRTESIILLGAGGGTRELIALMRHDESCSEGKRAWRVEGILDDNRDLIGSVVAGVPVLGVLADVPRHTGAKFICGIANARDRAIRLKVAEQMGLPDERWATFVHPHATVLDTAVLDPGVIIYPNAVVSSDVKIGAHSLAYYGAVVHHDSVVGEGCCICAGVLIAGYVNIGRGCYLGMGATVRDRVRIGDGVLVGMGAAVVRDVEPGQIVAGVPARPLYTKGGGAPARRGTKER